MRFNVAVNGAGTGSRSISLGDYPLRQVTLSEKRPYAVAAELKGCDAQTAKICDPANLGELNSLYDRFLGNGLAQGESNLLGKYLCAVPLGPNWFDQRVGDTCSPTLLAADEVVWSCYRPFFWALVNGRVPEPAPLPYIEADFSPSCLRTDRKEVLARRGPDFKLTLEAQSLDPGSDWARDGSYHSTHDREGLSIPLRRCNRRSGL